MGWKAIKEHYRIGHSVCVTDAGICIGSPYIHELIVIGLDGKLLKRDDGRANADLSRYMQEFDADPDQLIRLAQAEDTFSASVTVYTYAGADIIEKQCEEVGWPNCTHDGELMYDNTFSTNKQEVVEWAKENARAGIESRRRRAGELRDDIQRVESSLQEYRDNLSDLEEISKVPTC